MIVRSMHISMIRPGDTVIHANRMMTVCRGDLSRDMLMGLQLFGDCYRLGHKLVQHVTFEKVVVSKMENTTQAGKQGDQEQSQ